MGRTLDWRVSAGHTVSSVLIYLQVNSDAEFPEQDVAYLKGPGEWQGALTAGLCQIRVGRTPSKAAGADVEGPC